MPSLSRREFLARSAAVAGSFALVPAARAADKLDAVFKISLAQWSHNKAFRGVKGVEKMDPLRFAEIAKKDYGIDAIEYVNQFYKDKKTDDAYLKELKKVADANGVKSILIMCDNEGALGDPDEKKRQQAAENHYRWVEWAKFLGCHSIRVNTVTPGNASREEKAKFTADGLRKLSEFSGKMGIATIVENHGGLSSDGAWLAGVMKMVDSKYCGTLPDFGNFGGYDRYKGVDELMPFAKGVSAKSHDFDDRGNETKTDYRKMMELVVKKYGYHGYVGIEYEGGKLSEADGIRATKKLLEAVRAELAKA